MAASWTPQMGSPPSSWWAAVGVLHQLYRWKFEDKLRWKDNDWALEEAWKGVSIGDIQRWPADATVIHKSAECILVLGSLKSAIDISGTNKRVQKQAGAGHRVDIVISMNADDRWHEGEPDCYETHYKKATVMCNLRYGGFDKQSIRGAEADAKRAEYISRWWQVAADLRDQLRNIRRDVPLVVLIHCFGGVNRSTSTLCALLIILYRYTAYEAINALVTARPGLEYWSRRGYFVEALYELEWHVRCVGALM